MGGWVGGMYTCEGGAGKTFEEGDEHLAVSGVVLDVEEEEVEDEDLVA